ncbi:Protein JTB [Taenia solium]|eukprot:TsM_000277300 transcript=TsM_000277300 gene=TsM_000277300
MWGIGSEIQVASIIFFIEESVTFALRPQRLTFDNVNPCSENQSFHYLTSCQPCSRVDMKSDPACKDTGHRVQVACDAIKPKADDKNGNKMADSSTSKWVSCDPRTFSDLQAERRSFVIFEAFVGCCGLASYLFVRRQHRRLDQRLVDRVNRQILASS